MSVQTAYTQLIRQCHLGTQGESYLCTAVEGALRKSGECTNNNIPLFVVPFVAILSFFTAVCTYQFMYQIQCKCGKCRTSMVLRTWLVQKIPDISRPPSPYPLSVFLKSNFRPISPLPFYLQFLKEAIVCINSWP